MKCNNCPAYIKTSYEHEKCECYAGVSEGDILEDKDGNRGCKLHWRTVNKRIQEHDSCYDISTAEAQKLCNPEEYEKTLERANSSRYINAAKHCLGLDKCSPYKRNGKAYYRPYMNIISTNYNNPIWSDFKYLGFAECDKMYWKIKDENEIVNFRLNEDGKRWLADKLGIYKIWDN